MTKTMISAAVMALIAGTGLAQESPTATATLQGRDGAELGSATFYDTASGTTWIVVQATGVPPGVHGVHVHETGDCSADDFTSAGGHLAGDMQHGILVEGGPHPGDLPNAHVQDDGNLAYEAFQDLEMTEEVVFDNDGSAVIIHSGADDYESQPAGDAGERIACGVIERQEG